jgi:hemoglobin-like flavoprotein
MMPVYYIPNAEVNTRDVTACQNVWNMILEDQSPKWLERVQSGDKKYPSCITWFYNVFYERLFNVHPLCRPLFTKGIESIGSFLVQMVSMSLSMLRDNAKFKRLMAELAKRHCERGVKASEYGIIGEVLFYSLRVCLGETVYSTSVETAWKKIFSVMLKEIVPLCVNYERTGIINVGDARSSNSDSKKSGERA